MCRIAEKLYFEDNISDMADFLVYISAYKISSNFNETGLTVFFKKQKAFIMYLIF